MTQKHAIGYIRPYGKDAKLDADMEELEMAQIESTKKEDPRKNWQARVIRDVTNKQIREKIIESLPDIEGEFSSTDILSRFNFGREHLRAVGIQLSRLAAQGYLCGDTLIPGSTRRCYRVDPGFNGNEKAVPPGYFRKNASEKARTRILQAMNELGDGELSADSILEQMGEPINMKTKHSTGARLARMCREGLVQKGKRIPGTDKTGWLLADDQKKSVPVDATQVDEALPVEVALADLRSRMRRPTIDGAERIVAELRGVARQFEDLEASELLISDFRRLADYLEKNN